MTYNRSMPASVTVQIVLPAELIHEIDDHIRRIAAIQPGGGPTRSALLRHWLLVAAPQMRLALEQAERAHALAELERAMPRFPKAPAKAPKKPTKVVVRRR